MMLNVRNLVLMAVASVVVSAACSARADTAGTVPIVYTTDLYHPHDDPDDHFDLATLFAIPDFDIRCIVIDMGERGKDRPGIPALKQMMHLTGREAPYATGLTANLTSQQDDGTRQPESDQAGVALILRALAESPRPVTVFSTGSLRDVAAAFNRKPELFNEKVGRIYVNAGDTSGKIEWNVGLDPCAYVRVLSSSLSVYWVPCFGVDGYQSLWQFRQGDVLGSVSPEVQNFFLYALRKALPQTEDPIAALTAPVQPESRDKFWAEPRNMWCTGALLHAAGRPDASFSFKPLKVELGSDGATRVAEDGAIQLLTFHVDDATAYPASMRDALAKLLRTVAPSR